MIFLTKRPRTHAFKICCLSFLFLLGLVQTGHYRPPHIQAAYAQDSYDYLDDGWMSPAEMAEEAEYIAALCATHLLRNQYYDCACVGGQFLIEREKKGPLLPQEQITAQIYTNAECINESAIAAKYYRECFVTPPPSVRRGNGTDRYCRCVSAAMLQSFKNAPGLQSRPLQKMNARARVSCRDPGFWQLPAQNPGQATR